MAARSAQIECAKSVKCCFAKCLRLRARLHVKGKRCIFGHGASFLEALEERLHERSLDSFLGDPRFNLEKYACTRIFTIRPTPSFSTLLKN